MELMKLDVDISKYSTSPVTLIADIMSAVKEPEPAVEETPIVEEVSIEESKKEKAPARYKRPAVKRK